MKKALFLTIAVVLILSVFISPAHAQDIVRWEQISEGMEGGQITAIAVDPQTSILYAGTKNGVYKSFNCGISWLESNTGLSSFDITTIEADPVNPSVVYAGTRTKGLFKSQDQGASWQAINEGLAHYRIRGLGVHPANPNILFLGTSAGIYRSFNGGASWTFLYDGEFGPESFNSFAFDPNNENTIYAGSGMLGVYKSLDGGNTWNRTEINNSGNNRRIIIDYQHPNIVYAVNDGSLYKTTDGGDSGRQLVRRWEIISMP